MRNSKPILLIEDDPGAAIMVRRAFKDLKVTNPLIHLSNGEEGLEYLMNNGNKKPCFIFSDWHMPKINGIEFLKAVKVDEVLKKIPIIILTLSDETRHIDESFKIGAAGYMIKPVGFKKLVEMIRTVYSYWTLSELPSLIIDNDLGVTRSFLGET